MAKKKSGHKKKRKRISGAPTYAGMGKPRRKRRHHHLMGKHKKRRRHRIGAIPGGMNSLFDYGMILLGGGAAKIGADLVTPTFGHDFPGFVTDGLIGAAKVGVGGLAYAYTGGHKQSKHPLILGATIGLGVSGLEDIGHQFGFVAQRVFMSGPADKTLYVNLDKVKEEKEPPVQDAVVVEGPSDAPIIAGHASYTFSGPSDAPIIGTHYGMEGPNDAPIIAGESEVYFAE